MALAIIGCLVLFIKVFRDTLVPLWLIFMFVVVGIVASLIKASKQRQKYERLMASLKKRMSDDTITFDKQLADAKTHSQEQNEKIAALKLRVSELEREIAPYRERFSQERMFKGFRDDPKPKQ